MRTVRGLLLSLVAATCCATAVPCSAIEAVRGKNYALTKQHGPWMIMVASFRNVPKDRREEGLSAEEAAAELVFELRERGIPAYVYGQKAVVEKIGTHDRQGRDDERIYAAQRDMVCVLAGNYPAIEDGTAQKTLNYVKKFRPKFMQDEKSGAIFRETPGQKGPLGGAFLTINPMLSPDEIISQKIDPDVVRMNHGSRFPLLSVKKKYTVQVATFTGKQTTRLGVSRDNAKEAAFDRNLRNPDSYGLSRAGEEAEQLVSRLREQGTEAYVHHDRYQSIVTVGAFNSPDDPLIAQIRKQFSPKLKPDPNDPKGKQESLQPETLIIPGEKVTDLPKAVWVFDLQPHVIQIPKAK